MQVTEAFFSVDVHDMQRATTFYTTALGATVTFASERWSSLRIAGVRIGLLLHPHYMPGRIGLHFVVADLESARAEIVRAGGRVVTDAMEAAPGVIVADVTDSEGNTFSLRAQ